ncbi:hypothetical protein F6Y05_01475 (plasmid) [Bacillus megaterium]|nr:hypothetical protein [Priestia megaterium]NGY85168.1 hypothetical protein [Priestia megaterium]NGY89366.1 hypothetical protein [Priestia megaterium]
MNPYEQLQLNKEVEEMAKQRIEIHKKRMELSEELENNWDNKELQDRIIELEEESQKLKKKLKFYRLTIKHPFRVLFGLECFYQSYCDC